eukprot:COSAG03_NODE_2110_length_3117_cov_2.292909_3_plen_37_part_00
MSADAGSAMHGAVCTGAEIYSNDSLCETGGKSKKFA